MSYRFAAPRSLEAFLERELGGECVDSIHICSLGLTIPVPIMGVAAYAYRGHIIPRVAGGTGFSSLSDLIMEATTGGKRQDLVYSKVGNTAQATAGTNPLWNVGNLPAAGGLGGTSGTGSVPTNATTGGLKQVDPAGSDTLHLTTWSGQETQIGQLLLYDRLWHMTLNHASALQTVIDSANRPTRYQTAALAPGNFCTNEITTTLVTAHNIIITYVDQDGNAAEAAATQAELITTANRIALAAPQWTYTLNAGDTGLRYLTQLDQSTITSVTGNSTFIVGHPLAILPQPVANVGFVLDGINSAFSLIQIQVGACLAFMDFIKPATTAGTYNGIITLVSG